MKAVIFAAAIIGLFVFGIYPSITGNLTQSTTLTGIMTDVNGQQLPQGRLVALDQQGNYIGEGGVFITYTLTLTSWPDQIHIYYYDYDQQSQQYCTTLNTQSLYAQGYSNLQCQFSAQLLPPTQYPYITKPQKQGNVWIV